MNYGLWYAIGAIATLLTELTRRFIVNRRNGNRNNHEKGTRNK
jgi:hypothetical protein